MKKKFLYLTYAGTVPFAACAVCLSTNINQIPVLGSTLKVLSVYALVISSYLSGIHWGQHLHIKGKWGHYLPILSNCIALTLWLGFLTLNFKTLVGLFSVTFALLFLIDYRLFKLDIITPLYIQTRFFASVIVIISLITSGIVT